MLSEAPSHFNALRKPLPRMVSTSDAPLASLSVSGLGDSGSPQRKASVLKHSAAQHEAALCEPNGSGGDDGDAQHTSQQPHIGCIGEEDSLTPEAVSRQDSPTHLDAQSSAEDLIAALRKGKDPQNVHAICAGIRLSAHEATLKVRTTPPVG